MTGAAGQGNTSPENDEEPNDAPHVRNIIRDAIVFGPVVQAGRIDSISFLASLPLPTPRQLPRDTVFFAGRQKELLQLDRLIFADPEGISGPIVITALTGSGGVGKTALAVHWAHSVKRFFPDGQLYYDLRGYDSSDEPARPDEVVDSFLQSLNVPIASVPQGLATRLALYRSILADRKFLVVLDNARDAQQVRPLVPATNQTVLLVTSRSTLKSLVAREGAKRISINVLNPDEALGLLELILGADKIDGERDAVSEICRACAYLPLALRIVAEQLLATPNKSLAGVSQDLAAEQGRLDLMETGDDEATAIRTIFSWSYNLLTAEVARTFRRIGLHPGIDISLPAAAAVSGLTVSQAKKHLSLLSAVHMIEPGDPDRYRFHDLLRLYSLELAEKVDSRKQRESSIGNLYMWYLHTAINANNMAFPRRSMEQPDQLELHARPLEFSDREIALGWLSAELKNIVALVRQADAVGFYVTAVQLYAALSGYFILRKGWLDWVNSGTAALAAARLADDKRWEGAVLHSLATAYQDLQQYDRASEFFTEALRIRLEINDRRGQAATLHNFGQFHRVFARHDESLNCYRRALEIWTELEDRYGEGLTLNNIGETYGDLGQFELASRHSADALKISLEAGDKWSEGNSRYNLARFLIRLSRLNEAARHIEITLDIRREIKDVWG